ncbi:hypothetical protein ACFU7X_02345 [Streptomyces chartreusis]|uniref:hypothetical protein n=1 Tax=Streptomyces chartreusis TaxID=1969 RepID=UPI003695F6BB
MLIRSAPERNGIPHRVAGGPADRGWLATNGHRGAAVCITAHHPKSQLGYDVPTDGLTGIHAVITEGIRRTGTSP